MMQPLSLRIALGVRHRLVFASPHQRCRAAAQIAPAFKMADLELPALGALLAEHSVPTVAISAMPFASASAAPRCASPWTEHRTASDRSPPSDHDQAPVQIPAQYLVERDSKQRSACQSAARIALAGANGAAQLPDSGCVQQGEALREQCQPSGELPLPDLAAALAGPHSCSAAPAPAASAAVPVLLMPAIGKVAAASAPRGCGCMSLRAQPLFVHSVYICSGAPRSHVCEWCL